MGQYYWSPGLNIKNMEESFVADALHFYNNSEQSAANALGISVTELQGIVARSQFNAEQQKKADTEHAKKSAEFLARSRGLVYRDPETLIETVMPFPAGQAPTQPAEGLDPNSAAAILAGRPVTPENALPVGPVLANVGDPVSAAKKTAEAMKEIFPE